MQDQRKRRRQPKMAVLRPSSSPDKTALDRELEVVAEEIRRLDPKGFRTAMVLRNSIDQLYDGQRTGRYCWDQLFKVEQTKGGHIVEINLHREFQFKDGLELDYQIAGIDVDCKYSQSLGGWMIPPEAHEKLCLVVWAVDSNVPRWSMGIVRATIGCLNTGGNRDKKATLNEAGRNAIEWLFKDSSLPPNVLLQLDPQIVGKIMAQKSGVKRINELFRNTLGMRVGRAVVATVAQQDDYMKRVRANGGARTALQPEGIIILGQYESHAVIARALGVVVPGPGDSVSVRVVAANGMAVGVVKIDNRFWRIARPTDPNVFAPDLPEI